MHNHVTLYLLTIAHVNAYTTSLIVVGYAALQHEVQCKPDTRQFIFSCVALFEMLIVSHRAPCIANLYAAVFASVCIHTLP
jgi:hypothetical protein